MCLQSPFHTYYVIKIQTHMSCPLLYLFVWWSRRFRIWVSYFPVHLLFASKYIEVKTDIEQHQAAQKWVRVTDHRGWWDYISIFSIIHYSFCWGLVWLYALSCWWSKKCCYQSHSSCSVDSQIPAVAHRPVRFGKAPLTSSANMRSPWRSRLP